jgi:hypothetical protein
MSRGEQTRDYFEYGILGAKEIEASNVLAEASFQRSASTAGVKFGKTLSDATANKEIGWFRHKNVLWCPTFYIGLLFVVRFRILKLDFPDLSQPSQWYFYFLFLFLLLLLPLKEYIFCKT